MEINSTRSGEVVIVHVNGRMDATTVDEFTGFVGKEEAAEARRMVVNLSGLEYISSAGLRGLLTLAKSMENRQGILWICGLSGLVREVFTLSGFDKILNVADDVDSALARS